MKRNTHEQGVKGRRYSKETLIRSNSPSSNEEVHAAEFDMLRYNHRVPNTKKLKRALDAGILKFSAVLSAVNTVVMLLTALIYPDRIPDALVLPVCSILLMTALIFLRNAALQYAAEIRGITQDNAAKRQNCAENGSELSENSFLSA